MVSITQFNKGQASKIFDRVKTEGRLVVLKNNAPSAIILSFDEYKRLTEIEENEYLLRISEERAKYHVPGSGISKEVTYDNLGISQKDIDETEDVEIE
jgi:prevent-host-death family protein